MDAMFLGESFGYWRKIQCIMRARYIRSPEELDKLLSKADEKEQYLFNKNAEVFGGNTGAY